MAEQWRIRRGTNTENNAFTGALGEVTMDTDRNEVRIHDGTTQGGKVLGRDYMTNCITEIPQDINLELNNGTLTLKAGSKVYVPNGSGNFDIYTESTDRSITLGDNGAQFICVNANTGGLQARLVQNSVSGAGVTTTAGFAYNTTTNQIRFYNASGIDQDFNNSFPIAIVTVSGGTITSIDQVFNSFGYIGSSRFVLPGIKWLSPDGRNVDGTLKSIQRTNTNVLVETLFSGTLNNIVMVLGTGSIWTSGKYIESETEPSGNYIVWYKPSENILRDKAEGSWNINNNIVVYGYYDAVSSQIASFRTKQPFHAVNYNDTEYIAHQAMPSDKYIDLTLGANGSSYTAPADGYVYLWKVSNAADQYITLTNRSNGLAIHQWTPLNGGGCAGYIPVSKGDIVDYTYTAGGAVNIFRFIYANGAK